MKKILYLFLTGILLCSLCGCNDSDEKTYSSYISRFVWVNASDHKIDYLKIYGCITKEWGLGVDDQVVKELKGSTPVYLEPYLAGKQTVVQYDIDSDGVIIYAYEEMYWPSDPEYSDPKNLQDMSRYVYEAYEEGDTYVMVWTYTFTNADYEAAKARGRVEVGII